MNGFGNFRSRPIHDHRRISPYEISRERCDPVLRFRYALDLPASESSFRDFLFDAIDLARCARESGVNPFVGLFPTDRATFQREQIGLFLLDYALRP